MDGKLKKSRVEFVPDPYPGASIFRLDKVKCQVNGHGLWYYGQPRKYDCVVHVHFDEENAHALRIYVVPKGYKPDKVGLIYTDEGFLKDIKEFFKALGMPAWSEVDYSEQGMQGDNYIDMEVYSKKAVKWVKDRCCGTLKKERLK